MERAYLQEREDFLSEISAELEAGRYDDAIARADARLKRLPGDVDAHLVRATCRVRMGRPAEAGEVLEQWHTILREQSQVYESLGDAYRQEGMNEEAIRSYVRFMGIHLGTPEERRVSEKVRALQGSDSRDEEDPEPAVSDDFHTITLAKLYVRQGHFKMAGDVIDRILQKDPGTREAMEYVGHVHHLIKKGWGPVIGELERWLGELQERTKP